MDSEKGYAVLQIYVKKRKAGFIESVVQIATYLETAELPLDPDVTPTASASSRG